MLKRGIAFLERQMTFCCLIWYQPVCCPLSHRGEMCWSHFKWTYSCCCLVVSGSCSLGHSVRPSGLNCPCDCHIWYPSFLSKFQYKNELFVSSLWTISLLSTNTSSVRIAKWDTEFITHYYFHLTKIPTLSTSHCTGLLSNPFWPFWPLFGFNNCHLEGVAF